MKAAKPQPNGPGSHSGPGRRRYFVNIVTEDQILAFQNEVSLKSVVPLLAPGKRENRLLILAPNTETIESFQKRALTQFQYSTNVSADAVKLLEANFCEVPRSYSVLDALDARSETYLVVENIRVLGPSSKRKISDSIKGSSSPTPEGSPRGEPSAKRLRRREKQASKLAASELEVGGKVDTISSESSQKNQLAQSKENLDQQKPIPKEVVEKKPLIQESTHTSNAHKPLFGRSRAESERRPSLSVNGKSENGIIATEGPSAAVSLDKRIARIPNRTGTVENNSRGRESSNLPSNVSSNAPLNPPSGAPSSQETPNQKSSRSTKANATPIPVAKLAAEPKATLDIAETSKNDGPLRSNRDTVQEELSAKDGEPALQSQDKKTAIGTSKPDNKNDNRSYNQNQSQNAQHTNEVEKDTSSKKIDVKKTSKPSNYLAKEDSEHSPNIEHKVADSKDNEEIAESEISRDFSDSVDSDSSGSESDSGERQRRLSRRRVVALSNTAPSTESNPVKKPVIEPKPTSETEHISSNKPATHVANSEVRPEPKPKPTQSVERGDIEKKKSESASGFRIPGLGSLADLANMRLPTVHEQNYNNTSTTPAKKPLEEESSEEEEDNNESDDSNNSDSSNSDSSDDDDTSTAGRKSRKRGLLGLLGNK